MNLLSASCLRFVDHRQMFLILRCWFQYSRILKADRVETSGLLRLLKAASDFDAGFLEKIHFPEIEKNISDHNHFV